MLVFYNQPLAESPEDWITWQNDVVDGPLLTNTEDKHGPFPARMCTVSHCHAILTGDYKYRRCEQHRVQNRHHSKLKRVREKEMKVQAAAQAGTGDEFHMWEPRGEVSKKDEEVGPLFTRTPMHLDRDSRSDSQLGDNIEVGCDVWQQSLIYLKFIIYSSQLTDWPIQVHQLDWADAAITSAPSKAAIIFSRQIFHGKCVMDVVNVIGKIVKIRKCVIMANFRQSISR